MHTSEGSDFVQVNLGDTDHSSIAARSSAGTEGIMIQDVREFTAHSVEEAAQLAGMEPSEWAALEDGDIVVDPAWLRPMADALGIRYDRMQAMVHLCQFVW
jgi:Helix-turn-helix domain